MSIDLNCKEVSRLISEGLDQALPPKEKARLRLHFVICSTCRNVNEQFVFLRNAMRQLGERHAADEPVGKKP